MAMLLVFWTASLAITAAGQACSWPYSHSLPNPIGWNQWIGLQVNMCCSSTLPEHPALQGEVSHLVCWVKT